MSETENDLPTEKIRLGVIGAGRIAQVAHLPALVKARNVELVAISDPSPALSSGVAARYGIPAFQSTAELLATDIDAVLVATPDRFHFPLGKLALEAGKHVLMEKPLAATSAEAAELAGFAAANNLKLQVGAMKRHDPGMAFAASHLPRLGRILAVRSWYRVMSALRPATEATHFPDVISDPEVRAVENTFKSDRERYLLATHGAHLFDGLEYLAGGGDWVSARMGNVGDDYSWQGIAGIKDGSGAGSGLISFEVTASVHGEWSEGTEIHGEFGHISTRSHFPFLKQASDVEVHIEADGISLKPHFGDTDAYKLQAEHFAESILEGRPVSPDPADGVAAVNWIEKVFESATNDGREVSL